MDLKKKAQRLLQNEQCKDLRRLRREERALCRAKRADEIAAAKEEKRRDISGYLHLTEGLSKEEITALHRNAVRNHNFLLAYWNTLQPSHFSYLFTICLIALLAGLIMCTSQPQTGKVYLILTGVISGTGAMLMLNLLSILTLEGIVRHYRIAAVTSGDPQRYVEFYQSTTEPIATFDEHSSPFGGELFPYNSSAEKN